MSTHILGGTKQTTKHITHRFNRFGTSLQGYVGNAVHWATFDENFKIWNAGLSRKTLVCITKRSVLLIYVTTTAFSGAKWQLYTHKT
jgi:hypothetical protein